MKKPIEEYTYLRAIAVLLVILSHCTYYKIITDYGSIDYGINATQTLTGKILVLVTQTLYSFHMPLFVALSGCLWAVGIKEKGLPCFRDLIKNKGKRLLIPFLLTTFLWLAPLKFLSGYWHGSTYEIVSQIFLGQVLMFGHFNCHLWFLQSLFIIFIFAYFIERYKLRRCPIKFAVSLLLISITGKLLESHHFCFLNIQSAFIYLLWFYMGFYFEHKRERINKFVNRYIGQNIAIAFIIIYPVCTFFCNRLPHGMGLGYITYYPMAVLGIIVTYILCYKFKRNASPQILGYINKLSSNSYGLYLYSAPVNYIIIYFISYYSLSDLFAYDSFTAIVYAGRFFTTLIVATIIVKIFTHRKRQIS